MVARKPDSSISAMSPQEVKEATRQAHLEETKELIKKLNHWLIYRSDENQLIDIKSFSKFAIDMARHQFQYRGWDVAVSSDRDGQYMSVKTRRDDTRG